MDTLPKLLAGSCIVFLALCFIAIYHSKREKRKQALRKLYSDVNSSTRFYFDSSVYSEIIRALKAKNYNPAIALALKSAEMSARFNVAEMQMELAVPFSEAGRIADQLEYIGFVSTFDNGIRRWTVSRDYPQMILDAIAGAKPYPG